MNVILIKDIQFNDFDNLPILIRAGDIVFVDLDEGIGFKNGIHFDILKDEYIQLDN